jgi:tRNA(Arg) A34 adenosine deaminase TadA
MTNVNETAKLDTTFLREAIRLARSRMLQGRAGPFGAVVARDGIIVARGWNAVTSGNDPTAHAEVVAIRRACRKLGTFSLAGCVLYASCEPCPMCLAAAYWARVERLVYAATREDAAVAGFDDAFIYDQVPLAPEARSLHTDRLLRAEAAAVFEEWLAKPDRVPY